MHCSHKLHIKHDVWKKFLELLGPKVGKPMILEMDNKINMGIFNN